MLEKVTKPKKAVRKCKDCVNFRWLSVRYGVCSKGEHPSDPRECVLFRDKKKC